MQCLVRNAFDKLAYACAVGPNRQLGKFSGGGTARMLPDGDLEAAQRHWAFLRLLEHLHLRTSS